MKAVQSISNVASRGAQPAIEEIEDMKHHKYMIMVAVFGLSTVLYCVPFALSLIDIATSNKFGKYTIFVISGIYLLLNVINMIVYVRQIVDYNKTIRVLEVREAHERRVKVVPKRGDHMRSDHIIVNMPGGITGQSK
jgi:hypothetical protein